MNMNLLLAIVAGVLVLAMIFVANKLTRRKPHKLNSAAFQQKWDEIQKLCADSATWPLAIINADKLVDDALKKQHYKGKTMGERMVAAQHEISDNDGLWFGHKMRNKLVHEEMKPLKKNEVVRILASFRQALRDLGALK